MMTEQIWTPVISLSDVGENGNVGNDISLVARSSGGGRERTNMKRDGQWKS